MTHNTREIEEIVQQFLNKFAVWNNQYVWAEPDGVQSKCTPYDVANWLNTTLHHQLQKARQNWLREEIVRLEGMYKKELEISFEEAHENYIHNKALQTIIDRYSAELDQPINSIFKE